MIDTDQRGWRFEPYEDDSSDDGYYTFRAGGPLYVVVEPANPGWQMCIFLEETDDPVCPVSSPDSLAAAQAAAGPAILDILEAWRQQTLEVWQQTRERKVE